MNRYQLKYLMERGSHFRMILSTEIYETRPIKQNNHFIGILLYNIC